MWCFVILAVLKVWVGIRQNLSKFATLGGLLDGLGGLFCDFSLFFSCVGSNLAILFFFGV